VAECPAAAVAAAVDAEKNSKNTTLIRKLVYITLRR
jgi:hypothetical protein